VTEKKGKNPSDNANARPSNARSTSENVAVNASDTSKGFHKKDRWLVLVYFGIFLFLSHQVPYVIGAVVLAFYFSVILDVPYEYLMRKTKQKWLAVISYILVVVLFVYAVISFFPTVINEVQSLFSQIQNANINGLPEWVQNILKQLGDNLSTIVMSLVNQAITFVPSLVTMVMLLVAAMIGLESIKSYIGKNLDLLFVEDPAFGRKFAVKLFSDVRRYVRGQVLVSLISATLTTIGLFVLDIPSALTFGVLTFVGGFFPYIGIIITSIPIYLLGFSVGGLNEIIWVTVLLVGVNQAETWLYGPKIQSDNLKIHWFIIMASILIFVGIFGFSGVLIALPVLLFIRDFWKFYVKPLDAKTE